MLPPPPSQDPQVAAALAAAGRHLAAPQDDLARQDLLDQLARLDAGQLDQFRQLAAPDLVGIDLPDLIADALLTETVPLLAGTSRQSVARRAERRADGSIWLARGLQRRRQLPAPTLDLLRGWLARRIGQGARLDPARAEVAAMLGMHATVLLQPRRRPELGALDVLGRMAVTSLPAPAREAVLEVVRQILAEDPALAAAVPPGPARNVVDAARAAAGAPAPEADPYAPLRPSQYDRTAAEINDAVTRLARELTGALASGGDIAAVLAGQADRLAELATGLTELTAALERFALFLDERFVAEFANARRLGTQVGQRKLAADEELNYRDAWATARHEAALAGIAADDAIVQDSSRAGAAYFVTGRVAREAQEAAVEVQHMLQDLVDRSSGQPTQAQVDDLVQASQGAFDLYRRFRSRWARILPPIAGLDAAVPDGHLPHLRALVAELNRMLAEHGVDAVLTEKRLQRMLRARWRWLVGHDGTILLLGAGTPAEVRIRFRIHDMIEVADPPRVASEGIVGQIPQFPQGTRKISGAVGYSLGPSGSVSPTETAGRLIDALIPPGSHAPPWLAFVRAALQHVSISLGGSRTMQRSLSSGGMDFALPGGVMDNRGPARLFSVTAAYEVSIRTRRTEDAADPADPATTWAGPVSVQIGHSGDRATANLWVALAYLESGQTVTERRADDPPAAGPTEPRHRVGSYPRLPDRPVPPPRARCDRNDRAAGTVRQAAGRAPGRIHRGGQQRPAAAAGARLRRIFLAAERGRQRRRGPAAGDHRRWPPDRAASHPRRREVPAQQHRAADMDRYPDRHADRGPLDGTPAGQLHRY